MTRDEALDVARQLLPSARTIWLDPSPVVDDDGCETWTGRFERGVDGSRATFAFDAHYPEGILCVEAAGHGA